MIGDSSLHLGTNLGRSNNQYNCHAALAEWNVKPLEETMKIHYFEGGITDPFFASVRKKHVLLCKMSPASHFFLMRKGKNKIK